MIKARNPLRVARSVQQRIATTKNTFSPGFKQGTISLGTFGKALLSAGTERNGKNIFDKNTHILLRHNTQGNQ